MMSVGYASFGGVMLGLTAVFVASMGVAAIRLLRGPSLADRVMAIDVLVMAAVATISVAAAGYDEVAMLDVAIAVSLVTFIGTVGVAWYLQRKGMP